MSRRRQGPHPVLIDPADLNHTLSWDTALRMLQEEHGPLLAQCLPRVYDYVPGDLSAQQLGLRIATGIYGDEAGAAVGLSDPTAQLHAVICKQLIAHAVPAWHVGANLLDALLATDLPDDVRFSDTPMPYPAFVLLVPHGHITDMDGCSVTAVQVLTMTPTEYDATYRNLGADFSQRGIFAISTVTDGPDKRSMGPIYHTARFRDQTMEEWKNTDSPFKVYCGASAALGDADLVEALVRLAISAAYLIADRPELVEGARAPAYKRIKSAYHPQGKVPVHPTQWLGRTFRHEIDHSDDAAGTHTNRTHWRRGHWRSQAHGEGRRLRRLTWIQPILIHATGTAKNVKAL